MADENHDMGVFDVNYWYRDHETCPYCGVSLRNNPQQNLYPHWTGACKSPEKP